METTLKDLVLQVSLTCRRTFGHKLRVSLAAGDMGIMNGSGDCPFGILYRRLVRNVHTAT